MAFMLPPQFNMGNPLQQMQQRLNMGNSLQQMQQRLNMGNSLQQMQQRLATQIQGGAQPVGQPAGPPQIQPSASGIDAFVNNLQGQGVQAPQMRPVDAPNLLHDIINNYRAQGGLQPHSPEDIHARVAALAQQLMQGRAARQGPSRIRPFPMPPQHGGPPHPAPNPGHGHNRFHPHPMPPVFNPNIY